MCNVGIGFINGMAFSVIFVCGLYLIVFGSWFGFVDLAIAAYILWDTHMIGMKEKMLHDIIAYALKRRMK